MARAHSPESLDRPVPDVSLASCDQLEEVHVLLLSVMKLPRSLENFLSSITSEKLRKISLTFINPLNEDLDRGDETEDEDEDEDEDELSEWSGKTDPWGSLDMILRPLARRVHDVGGKLTLQLNIQHASSKPFEFDHHVPKFLEYGGLDIKFTQVEVSLRPPSLFVSD
jgi:hypothetical protein